MQDAPQRRRAEAEEEAESDPAAGVQVRDLLHKLVHGGEREDQGAQRAAQLGLLIKGQRALGRPLREQPRRNGAWRVARWALPGRVRAIPKLQKPPSNAFG